MLNRQIVFTAPGVAELLEKEVAALRSQLDEKYGLENITGTSDAMKKVFRLIRQAAPSDANILIEGPSGTGKELVARAVHTLSNRAQGPFVAVECAALNGNLLESEPRRLHGRLSAPDRPFRSRQPRHDLSGRDIGNPAVHAGQTSARAGNAFVRTSRQFGCSSVG